MQLFTHPRPAAKKRRVTCAVSKLSNTAAAVLHNERRRPAESTYSSKGIWSTWLSFE